ncbi:MAG: tetratricopeptide repeat protein [Candidatus Peribacteraceae bacterium]|jgi:hypothetical protein|nr:tetratricopeptide repeat protein [Candidatus Peribacteraceae bacterium]
MTHNSSHIAPRLWIQIAAIISITVAIYQYAPQGQFMNIDDNLLIYKNPVVQELNMENIKTIFSSYDPELYIPFTLLSYMIEYHFVGPNPSVFHTTNVLLHILNALLVFALIRYFSKKWIIPFLTAVLFAVHPLNTEAVMWISGRKDLLSAFFFLGSLVLYCRHRVRGDRLSFYSSLVLFICALMSKIIAVTLPLVTLLIDDILPAKSDKHKTVKQWVFGVPALIFLSVAMMGKMLSVFLLSYIDALLLALKGIYFYFVKFLIPTNLSMVYEQLTPIGILREDFLFPVLALIALAVITICSRAFGKWFSFGILWFGITLLPNLGNAVKGVESSVYYASDRYVYLPSIGIFFLVACGIAWGLEQITHIQKIIASVAIVIVIGIYGFVAHQYAIDWLTPKGYLERTVKLYPEAMLSRILLGMTYMKEENDIEAISHFRKAVERKPEYANPRAHLGLTLVKIREVDEGIEELEKALKANSRHTYSYVYLSFAYMLKNNNRKAELLLSEALAKDPGSAKALQMYGMLEYRRGNLKVAEQYYRKSIDIDSTSAQAKSALARLLRDQ